MNKDTIIASSIGFGLGLIAAIALWVVPRILPKTNPSASPTNQVAQKSVEGETKGTDIEEKLNLSSPQDGDILTANKVNVEGSIQGAQSIVVTTPQTNQVATLNPEGKLSTELNLTEGANPITVAAYINGEVFVKTVTVFYYAEGI